MTRGRHLLARGFTRCVMVLCLAWSAEAGAQDPDPPQDPQDADQAGEQAREQGLESMTITARKLEENLQDTPVAVTAFSGDDLQRSSFQTVQDIALKVPGLRWEPVPTQGNTPTISLRGMSQNDSIPTLEAAVGVYFDGIFMGKLQGGQANLMDVERIEVLKGPQGTLYGKNTLGGAINVVAKRPDGTLGGYGRVTLGNYNRRDLEGAIQFPIAGETLSARIAFQSADREGFHDFKKVPAGSMVNVPGRPTLDFTGKSDGDENEGLFGRVSLRWAPGERFEANGHAYRIEQKKTIQAPSTLARLDRSGTLPLAIILGPDTGVLGVDPRVVNPAFSLENLLAREDPWESYSNVTGNRDDLDVTGGGITADFNLTDILTLRSITGTREVDGARRGDMDGTPYAIWENDVVYESRQFSEELQLLGSGLFDGSVDLVSGVFFFDETAEDDSRDNFAEAGFPVGAPRDELDAKARSYAAYTQANYGFTDRLRGTAGVRFTDEKRWMRNGFVLASPLLGRRVDARFSEWTYTYGLDYQIQDGVLVYAKASNGFRSGGFDGRASFAAGAVPFDTEKLTQYESGVKSEWYDNRLRVNLAAYFSNYKNIQLTNLVPPPPGALCAICTVRVNAGRAKIMGGELEIQAAPTEGLMFSAGVEVNKFDYESGPLADLPAANVSPFIPAPGSTLEPQNQPKLTFNLSATYDLPPTPLGIVSATVDWIHLGQIQGSPTNASFLEQDKHGFLNGRLSLLDEERGLEYAAFIRNALDREYHFSGVDFFESGIPFGTRSWGAPRTFGLEISYRFGSDRS